MIRGHLGCFQILAVLEGSEEKGAEATPSQAGPRVWTQLRRQSWCPPHAPGSRAEVVVGRCGGEIVVLRKVEVLVQPLTVRCVSKTGRDWKFPGDAGDIRMWRHREGDATRLGGGLGVPPAPHPTLASQPPQPPLFLQEPATCSWRDELFCLNSEGSKYPL